MTVTKTFQPLKSDFDLEDVKQIYNFSTFNKESNSINAIYDQLNRPMYQKKALVNSDKYMEQQMNE